MNLDSVLARVDRFQEDHAGLGFLLAVGRKYSEDRGSYLAATIAYYGFFSFFPLLLVLVTTLGYVLNGHPHLERQVLSSAVGQLPVIGPELARHSLHGSAAALAIGIAISLWTGTGVLLAAENAMGRLWDVPGDRRFGFVAARVRALGFLAVLGSSLVATTVISAVGTAGGEHAIALRVGAIVLAVGVDIVLFWLAFGLLTPSSIGWSCHRGGALVAGVGYEALQLIGSYYVTHTLRHASEVYGTFAIVIGLLSWIYLTATVVLLSVEGNVVATRRLWPRPLRNPRPSTETEQSRRGKPLPRRPDRRRSRP
jgi:membrane protein